MKISTKLSFVLLFLMAVLIAPPIGASAQNFAIKNNLLYDATTTPNIGAEIGVGKRSTINLVYGINPWEFSNNRMAKHWVLMPEYRWWQCCKFNGWFYGIHAMGGQFNASNINIPFPGAFFSGDNLRQMVRDTRCEGRFIGGGVTVGYQWILGQHWNLEAELGVGYDRVWYDQYPCSECGSKLSSGATNYIGVTKIGISFLYLF